jgi:3-dehydroquinate dehydratase/shikimate dehydrogenase
MTQKSLLSPLKPKSKSSTIIKLMKKQPLICTSITASTAGVFMSKTKIALNKGSDIAELRIDSLKNQSPENIKKIISDSCLPLIVTNRNKENRGLFPSGNEQKRLSLLLESMEAKPAFIDIELHTEEKDRIKIIDAAKKKGIGIICSYHDFVSTPSSEKIIKIFKEVSNTGADIAKLVFTPHTKKDIVNILHAVEYVRYDNMPSTIFGMGDMGQDTRILSPVLGSCLTYCSIKPDPTNGLSQVSVKDTRAIFDLLTKQKKGWTSVRKEHKELLALAITEFMSKENYPFIGRLINA